MKQKPLKSRIGDCAAAARAHSREIARCQEAAAAENAHFDAEFARLCTERNNDPWRRVNNPQRTTFPIFDTSRILAAHE